MFSVSRVTAGSEPRHLTREGPAPLAIHIESNGTSHAGRKDITVAILLETPYWLRIPTQPITDHFLRSIGKPDVGPAIRDSACKEISTERLELSGELPVFLVSCMKPHVNNLSHRHRGAVGVKSLASPPRPRH